VILVMDIKRHTPVPLPPISASATEADSSEDPPEMREEMEEWKQRVETLVKTENFEEVVSNNDYILKLFVACKATGAAVSFSQTNRTIQNSDYYYYNRKKL